LKSYNNTDLWAKAGVMIRETLESGSKFAAVYITPGMVWPAGRLKQNDRVVESGCSF